MTPLDPETWFHRRAAHVVSAQAMYHLNDCGVFAALAAADGPRSAGALAEELGLDRGVLETVLDFVVGVEPVVELIAGAGYRLTAFGRAVVARFSRQGEDGAPAINLFDVRVGAYGPVWENLGAMLRGDATYGVEVQRRGAVAADAVYKVSRRLAPAVERAVLATGATALLEVGATSGLAEWVKLRCPGVACVALDRAPEALAAAEARAAGQGATGIAWVQADLFDVPSWTDAVASHPTGLLVTVHAHEFLAAGEDRVVAWLRDVAARRPGWRMLLLEQPRPERDDPPGREATRLYGHANVLIHHLIGNGRILTRAGWRALFAAGGWAVAQEESADFLGYVAWLLAPAAAPGENADHA